MEDVAKGDSIHWKGIKEDGRTAKKYIGIFYSLL